MTKKYRIDFDIPEWNVKAGDEWGFSIDRYINQRNGYTAPASIIERIGTPVEDEVKIEVGQWWVKIKPENNEWDAIRISRLGDDEDMSIKSKLGYISRLFREVFIKHYRPATPSEIEQLEGKEVKPNLSDLSLSDLVAEIEIRLKSIKS